MKIALLTMGTRGDVQPFAILGKALKKRGHAVTLCSAMNYRDFIGSYGLDFVPVEADFQEILNSDEGKRMMRNPFSARKHLNNLIFPMMLDALRKFYTLARENDTVLFHVKAMADFYADGLNTKLIRANVVPAMEPTKEFVNPIISFMGLPSFLNRVSFKLSDMGMKMVGKPIKQFRKEIGLDKKFRKLELPSIYGLSSHFLPRPKDYPANSHYTGFWFEDSTTELDNDLLEFLSNGEPPLLLTLGSMPFHSRIELASALERITKELNIKILVIKGWGLANDERLVKNSNIKVVDGAPYDKLMPHVKAVVHHGGIGTVAECLRAGKPFLVCPVLYPFGDQHFWGTLAYKQKLGLKPIPLKQMNEEKLIKAVKQLLQDEQLHNNCSLMKDRLSDEHGVGRAIELIESF